MIVSLLTATLMGSPPPAPSLPSAEPVLGPPAAPAQEAELTAAQVFALAARYREQGRIADAEALLHALTGDRDPHVRAEARFRLGQSLMARGDHQGAVDAFAALLEEQPDAQPVRLELARALALQGNRAAAARQLRRAQTGGLPEDVQRLVDRFAAVLRSSRPWGGGLELGIAPDTNINQATSATTIDFQGIPLVIDPEGRATSGVGLTLAGDAYVRVPVAGANLVSRVAGQANLYGKQRFTDIALTVSSGPEIQQGQAIVRPAATYSYRAFGGSTYSQGPGASLDLLTPLSRTAQASFTAFVAKLDYRIAEQDGTQFSASARIEHALSPRLYARLEATGLRHNARAAAYSTTSYGGGALLSRDAGAFTVFARAGYLRTKADAPFAIFAAARRDDRVDLSAGLSWNRWNIAGLSPVVRLEQTFNASPLDLYRFKRTRVQFALAQRF